ncbi:AAA family ATPase [Slackia heliotrinireducens]|uniref:AAA family ATPase n=1 Tax=Slackia heliotrinireducens TaxID=84110 RepID=UPI0033160EFB
MPMGANPFTPTFGSVPPELAGRAQLIKDILEGLENGPGDPNRASIFVGPRGSGKTALLAAIAEQAEEMGWISVNVTAREGMLDEIMVQTREKGSHLIRPEASSHVTGVQIRGVGLSREMVDRRSTWRSEMTAILRELNDAGTGLLITVDEAASSSEELYTLVDVFQHFVREHRNVALLLAGLPHNVSLLLDDDGISFLRRAFRHSMEAIDDNDVADAIKETVENAGRSIDPKALALAARGAGGFAFLIQLIGYHMWRQHPNEERVTLEDVENALALAKHDMERMVLEPTVRSLTPREMDYLLAMTQDGSVSQVSSIAERMGVAPNNASKVRKRLVERGIIGPRGRGRVAFEVPMLKEYLLERAGEL